MAWCRIGHSEMHARNNEPQSVLFEKIKYYQDKMLTSRLLPAVDVKCLELKAS
jgi:hypothetical protein